MTHEGAQALLDRLIEGTSDYIITQDMLARGGAGEWDEAAVSTARWVSWGTLSYLADLSQRGGFEDELNVMLNRLVGQIEGASS